MAVPTPAVFVDPGQEFGMAAAAIAFHHRGAMIRDVDGFGDEAGMKGHRILETLHGFPKQVVGQVIVGEMAIYALDVLMSPGVKPGLVFRLQHMATAAKLRTLRPGIEARRSKGHEYPQNRNDGQGYQRIDQGFVFGWAHAASRFGVSGKKSEREYQCQSPCKAEPGEGGDALKPRITRRPFRWKKDNASVRQMQWLCQKC